MADPAGAVYGHALFESAAEAGRLREVEADLGSFGRALAGSRDLSRVLFNPAFPERGKKQILARLTTDADELVRNALQVLVDHGRLSSLPDVIAEFETRFRESQRQLQVSLTTAVEISDGQAADLQKRLADATGQEVELQRRVDPAILGGIVLRVGDLLFDASVRGRLDGLRIALRQARIAPQGEAA